MPMYNMPVLKKWGMKNAKQSANATGTALN